MDSIIQLGQEISSANAMVLSFLPIVQQTYNSINLLIDASTARFSQMSNSIIEVNKNLDVLKQVKVKVSADVSELKKAIEETSKLDGTLNQFKESVKLVNSLNIEINTNNVKNAISQVSELSAMTSHLNDKVSNDSNPSKKRKRSDNSEIAKLVSPLSLTSIVPNLLKGGLSILEKQPDIKQKIDQVKENANKSIAGIITELKPAIDQAMGLVDQVMKKLPGLIHSAGPAIKDFFVKYVSPGITMLKDLATWIGDNWKWLGLLVTVVGSAAIAFATAAKAVEIWTAAEEAFNLVANADPVFFIVAGIVALIAAVVYAWNKFETFRVTIKGVWELMKEFGKLLFDMTVGAIVNIVKGIGKFGEAIWDLFNGNFKEAADTAKKAVADISGITTAKQEINDINGIKNTSIELKNQIAIAYQHDTQKNKAAAPTNDNSATPTAATGAPKSTATANKSDEQNAPNIDWSNFNSKQSSVSSPSPRSIIININKPFIDKFTVNAQKVEQGLDDLKHRVEEILLEIINSANAVA